MVFVGAHLLFFHARGQTFEPGIGLLDPGSPCWPGDLFGVPEWVLRDHLRRNHFVVAIQALSQDPNECYGP